METQTTERIKYRNERLLDLLSSGCKHVEAAAELNISPRTIQRALEDEEFRSELQHLRQQKVTEAAARVSTLVERAVEVLEEAMTSASTTDRLRAARLVLEWNRRLKRDTEQSEQLDRIEAALQAREDTRLLEQEVAGRPDPVTITKSVSQLPDDAMKYIL
jgi:uncharacterized membrane-anchored protein YjiN (DUF445 family)